MKRILFCLLLLLLPVSVYAQADCYCVTLARTFNNSVPRLNADHWIFLPYNVRSTPVLGGQILMEYETQWDVATIVGFSPDGFLVAGVDFDDCGKTYRIIGYNDNRIRMFFNFS